MTVPLATIECAETLYIYIYIYIYYPWSEIATRLGSDLRKRPKAGRFRKFVEFDQSKGIGGLARPRRSRFGYWFGRPRRHGGEIDNNGVLNFGGPTVK